MRVGKVIGKYKMAKHFELDIAETSFSYRRKPESIAAEAALDGLYIVRTSLPATELDATQTVRAYKRLSAVERAFRSFKTVDLKVRPIYHYASDRVRAHIFLCMLAYYVEWHMRARLKPLLFEDDDPDAAGSSAHLRRGARRGLAIRQGQGPAQNRPPLGCRYTASARYSTTWRRSPRTGSSPRLPNAEPFDLITRPTALQCEAFKLLDVRLKRSQ